MLTITLKELRNTPGKVVRLVKTGKTVRVTRRGKPLFDAVPAGQPSGLSDFYRRLDETWGDYAKDTRALVAGIRESRE